MFALPASAKLITCILLPRFELAVAAGGRTELLGVPVAIAPEPGSQQIGAVSAAAEAFGIGPGMRLGEALARCQRLTLIPPDPAGVEERWEQMLIALESIGAAVEPLRPGLVCFDARGLLRLYAGDGSRGGPLGSAVLRQDIDAVLAAARRALDAPARFGVAPTRFAALAAATRARARQPLILTGDSRQTREFLAPMPVELLCDGVGELDLAMLPEALQRLGISTLGELAALPRAAVADRFGRPGLHAQRLALGGDMPLRPREVGEIVRESLELPESSSGQQLERALGLLIDRLLARRERRGRTLRAVVLSAVLVEHGGTWRQCVSFRESLSDPLRMRLALATRLQLLPAPAQTLGLAVERFGPPTSDQQALLVEPARARSARLREAIRQVRTAAGPDAALRVLHIDPSSRFPERRSVLTPFER
jgi:protein ImuB